MQELNGRDVRPRPNELPVHRGIGIELAVAGMTTGFGFDPHASLARDGFLAIAKHLGLEVERAELPETVKKHHQLRPFEPPRNVADSVLFLEGSFNPVHAAHLARVMEGQILGFKRIEVGVNDGNPLKSASEYEPHLHRVEMFKLLLRAHGLPISESRGEEGVWVSPDPRSFYEARSASWTRSDTYIMMGPDNLHRYLTTPGVSWALGTDFECPVKRDAAIFGKLYQMFGDRLLVPPTQYKTHSSSIRSGEEPPHEALRDYIEAHGLYGRRPN